MKLRNIYLISLMVAATAPLGGALLCWWIQHSLLFAGLSVLCLLLLFLVVILLRMVEIFDLVEGLMTAETEKDVARFFLEHNIHPLIRKAYFDRLELLRLRGRVAELVATKVKELT